MSTLEVGVPVPDEWVEVVLEDGSPIRVRFMARGDGRLELVGIEVVREEPLTLEYLRTLPLRRISAFANLGHLIGIDP